MALSKEIELQDGVTVRYHRIVSLNIITNFANLIEVRSYTSQAKREEEKEKEGGIDFTSIYTSNAVMYAPYEQGMTVETAYEWLKSNVDDFADAADVLED